MTLSCMVAHRKSTSLGTLLPKSPLTDVDLFALPPVTPGPDTRVQAFCVMLDLEEENKRA